MHGQWREVTTIDGPFASVYVPEPAPSEDAAHEYELLARSVSDELEHKGTSPTLVKQVVDAMAERPSTQLRGTRAVVATESRTVVDRIIVTPLERPLVRYSPVPYLLPLAQSDHALRPRLVVLVDAAGADIEFYGRSGDERDADSYDAGQEPVHKVRSGGPRGAYHDSPAVAEDAIRLNIAEVAEWVTRKAGEHRNPVVFVGGEVQSRSAVVEQLPNERIVEVESGSRSEGFGATRLGTEIAEHLLLMQTETMEEAAERYRHAASGDERLGVDGLEGVSKALREANLETLLVTEPTDATVFAGDQPTLVSPERADIDTGGAEGRRMRADEALPFAAIAVDADIIAVDERLTLRDGFGAILRHTTK